MKPLMCWAAVLAVLAGAMAVRAEVPTNRVEVTPGVINYQGRLVAADGSSYTDGLYNVEFRLYDADSGGSLLWGARYATYVKGGYFNVLLGRGGDVLVPPATHAPADLWKAMWFDAEGVSQNSRYLSLRWMEDKNNSPILPVTDAKEAFPRQQMICSPFAERAQMAQYARQSIDDFTVPGQAVVAGQIKGGNGISVAGMAAFAGPFAASNTATFATGIVVNGSAADINKGLDVDGAKTYLRQGVEVSGTAEFKGGLTVVAGGLNVAAGGLNVATGSLNTAAGVSVKVDGQRPIRIRRFNLGGGNVEIYKDSGYATADWHGVIVGFDFGYGDVDENYRRRTFACNLTKGAANWNIHYAGHYHGDAAGTIYVDVMFIRREFVDSDDRW